ncbi:hypothetical protein QYE76_052903 [Lolium multiflorum]|uniref:Uncharacterized protein n=1 Tax=Lolium multiflorum TaxID=4521 RepID=A0AAD8SVG1_LOLMU|nr:hypothetical protein QYE76_052903 [Lolium multiflorum]
MGKPRDTKIAILPSTTRKGTTLSTSAALDSPSVIDKLVSPPHASRAGTSAESENSHNIDNVSAVLDDSGSLGSFLDATIAKSRQIENTETPNAATPVNSPESVEYSSDDLDEDYVELDNDFIEKCKATTDARKIKKLLAEHAVRYKPSPDPKFATSPINIRDKDYDFSLDLSHIAIVEKTPFCGTEKESAVEHLTELSTLSGVFSDDVKMRTYFVAKIFPFSLKDDAKTWYNNLPPGSIKSPTDLRDVFFRKYFPASAQHAALQRIYNFDQEDGEKLPEAWARFCSLIRAQPDHDLEKHDLLDIFYSGLTIESRAYLDSCAGCVFRKRTPDDAEELLAKIGRNHDDWSTPEPTPTPIVKKRGMIKLNDEDMREAKKSLKEKGIKPEDVKNLPPIEDICETIPPSSMIEIRLKEDDEVKTAFITPYGVFCYKTMPFGLKNAGATYQRMMQKCLATQIGKNVQVYIDDVVITTKKGSTLIEDLKETFDNLDKFKLDPTKCSFGVPAGELLGFLVSARGIEANPEKIQAIVTMRKPMNLKEIQQLTGRVAALSRFVARLGEKALPFYALIKQGDKFQWNEEADRAFEDLKRTISTPPILVATKEKEPLLLYIAATPQVVSTVLVVEREEEGKLHGVQRPVYFVSEVLSPSKQRYPQYQKLAYGVFTTEENCGTIFRRT